MKSPMSRRALLRGAGGVAIALPFLDAMGPRSAFAQAPKAPVRLFTFLIENGMVPSAWFPTGTEKDFKMGANLNPLVPHQKNLILIDGLDNKASGGTCHARARCGSLTGQNNNAGRAAGISIDQAVANAIGAGTRLKSLNSSVYLHHNYIYGLFFSGPGQQILPLDEPADVFAMLFSMGVPMAGGGKPADPAAQAAFEALRARKKSILDHALEEYKRVSGTVGPGDQMRLQRHMDGIREIERGLALSGTGGDTSASCKVPEMPVGTSFPEHTKLQSELASMALACDITRVVSIQTRASLTGFTWIPGVSNTGQHALSHQQGSAGADAQLNKIATWFTEQVAYIVTMLKAFPDSNGKSLFDNTVVFYTNDLGKGTHSTQRYPVLLATGNYTLPLTGKPLETGRYLQYPGGTSLNDMLTSVGRIMGLDIKSFGNPSYSKGPLANLA
jgi:uncharacterized protein DUF1552